MVRLVTILCFVFWLIPFDYFWQSQSSIRKTVIVIDPGHGGTDSGAIGINGIQEKDMVLKVGKEMVQPK